MSDTWIAQGKEPTLDALLADPIMDLLLDRDGLTSTDVRRTVERARSGISCSHRPVAAE